MSNMIQWIDGLISSPRRRAIPIMTSPGISLIRSAPSEVFRSGELQFKAIKALNDKYPLAAALTMMDLSVEAEAFGAPIQIVENENPTILKAVIHDGNDVFRLVVPEVGTARTAECLLAARLCALEIKDRPTLGGIIGPFSLTGRLLDMSKMMLLTAMEPETVHAVLEKSIEFLIEYAKAFKEVGCGGVIMAEPAAGLVSPKMCREFSANYIKRLVDAVQDESFVVVLHNCGKTEKMVGEMLATGVSALHVGNAIDIRSILRQTPTTVPVMGNIDPSGILRMGTPEDVFRTTTTLLQNTKDYPHFVLSSGCDIPFGTPIENIDAFFRAMDDFNHANF